MNETEARCDELRRAADDIEREMGAVWGESRSWLTTGDHIAELMAGLLRERADDLAASEGD